MLPMKGGRISVTVDVVIFTIDQESLKILLVRRPSEPFKGAWALPGGFVQQNESVDDAALRLLKEKVQISNIYLEQLYTFGEPRRDPRCRVMTVAYYAVVNAGKLASSLLGLGDQVRLQNVRPIPRLAFDHSEIVRYALERLENKVNYTTICFQLLGKEFTFSELQRAYEIIVGERLDKRNFRKKMVQLGILKDLNRRRTVANNRPARLFSFAETGVVKLQEKGIVVPF